MAFTIAPDQLTISVDDPDTLQAIVAHLAGHLAGHVVTITTGAAEHTVTVLAGDPGHQPGHIYGAAFIEADRPEPDVALPVIAYTTIRRIHVY